MPLISVIIPAYNAENTIGETVESVLNQTFSDFEMIVIDDGSTDATLEKLKTVRDPRLRVLSQANLGSQRSRNRGLAEAVGEYVAFLDSDDLWTSDKLEAQLKALQAAPDAGVAYSWTVFIDGAGQFLRHGRHITVNGDALERLLVSDFLESGSNPLIRSQALLEVGGWDESLSAAQDWDLYLRLAAKYPFVNVPRSQILYRISPNSISSNVLKVEKNCLKIIETAFSQAPEAFRPLKQKSFAHLYRYLTFQTLDRPEGRRRALLALRYLWLALKYDTALRKDRRLLSIAILKSAISILFPPQWAQAFLAQLKTASSQTPSSSPP